MTEHKGVCLEINGNQTLKLRRGSNKFKNYFKLLPVPFKIYADFECNVKRVEGSNRGQNNSYTEKYQDHITCIFAYKVVSVNDKFSKPVVLYGDEVGVYKFIDAIFKEYDYFRGVIKKYFNQNLVKIYACRR